LLLVGGFVFLNKVDELQHQAQLPTEIHSISPLIDTLEVNGDLLSFQGKSDNEKFQVYYKLSSEKEKQYYQKLASNVLLKIEANLEIPEQQRNFNGFDYQKYLATQNIYQIVTIKTIKAVEARSNLDLRIVRRRAILWCQSHFPSPMSSYMTGLLFGYLGKDFDQMGDIYSALGIIHLFALSGMQVNFFLDWLRRFLLRIGFRIDQVDKFQLPFSIFYAFLTGLSVSILRALVQKNIRLKGLDNFTLTFFVLLLLSPKFLLTVGGGLTLFYAFLLMMLSGHFKELSGIKKILLESSILSLGVLPVLVINFHVFQPLSIILTFIFSVIFDSIMLPALVIIFALSVSIHLTLNMNFFFICLEYLVRLVDGLFHYPIVLGTPSLSIFLLLLFVTGLYIDNFKQKLRASLLMAIVFILFFIVKNPMTESITMIDIGQGDSFLLQDKFNKHTILIDTGGKVSFASPAPWQRRVVGSNADKTLIPYLQSMGIGTIDTLILTHTDTDHVRDLVPLSEKIKIRQILVDRGALAVSKMVKELRKTNTSVRTIKVGEKFPIFDSSLEVLSNGYTGKGDNNDSIVTYGDFYGTKFLFTGDLEKEGEKELLKDYPNLKADVLKAGHHGSKTASSPEFIKEIQPEIALISAGKNNRYHHPHQEILNIFEAEGVKVYRTNQQGAIRFERENENWIIKTMK
jgi:competence protein ComEC